MQLLAINKEGKLVSSQKAHRRKIYSCLECNGNVRVRGGLHRQLHYYHLEPATSCQQHQKSLSHIQVQSYLHCQFGEEDCALEYRMPEINRIADVVWFSQKIVFEIQCSFISAAEVSQRNEDYKKLGWSVVWILHEKRFNQSRYTAAEEVLQHSSHYYTNIDKEGNGHIYDQFHYLAYGWRRHKLTRLPIDVKGLKKMDVIGYANPSMAVEQRMREWDYYFAGDLVDCALKGEPSDYLEKVLDKEQLIKADLKKDINTVGFVDWLVGVYQKFFYYFLEKATR